MVAIATTATTTPTTQTHGLPDAIPLKVLYGNADKRMPLLSPDGKYIAYLADAANGVTNIFVKPVQFKSSSALVDTEAQQITSEEHRPLRFFMWSKSTTQHRILYVQDTNGDENFHLFVVTFALNEHHKALAGTIVVRDLTPFGPVTVMPYTIVLSHAFPEMAVIAMNQRSPSLFDAHKVDLVTGEVEMLMENPGDVSNWIVDDSFRIIGSVGMNPGDGSTHLKVPRHAFDTEPSEWKPIVVWPHGEISKCHLVAKGGKAAYYETSLLHTADSGGGAAATNTSRLVLLSLETGLEMDVIAQDPLCDVSAISINETERTIASVTFMPRVQIIDEQVRGDMEHLVSLCKGAFSLVSASNDNQMWVYADGPDDASLKYYIYDRTTRHHALLFDSRPELAKYTLVKMQSHVIKTSDNEEMVGYLSLPHGSNHENLPLVLTVHGGPWLRDNWGFDATHQHMANLGYACLCVNFRGSTGYGKRWTNLGDRQWGGTMQQDLTDAVHWAIKQGLADPARVAIFGGMYGGYATLAGLAFTPNLYACGVDLVGPSNIKTVFESIPAYWAPMKKSLVIRIGDVENDDELNHKISPLFHAHKIVKPLLIGQGANDPRVKRGEADQIAKKLHENNRDVQYVLYTDEGHGFVRPCNKLDFTWRVEQFLAAHLGGRTQPKDDALVEGNSAVDIDPATL